MVSVLKVVRVVISPAAVGEDHGAAVAGDGRRGGVPSPFRRGSSGAMSDAIGLPLTEKWHESRVVENRHWTDTLWSLRVEAPPLAFEAGQFVRIALDIANERVARPFSFVNPPEDPVLEFFGVTVPQGPLSPRLAELRAGDRLYVAPNPAGFLTLSEVPDAESLWLLTTGTGIAPFLSILRTVAPWKRFHNVVLVHAVRHARELVYQEIISRLTSTRSNF